jgi:predicted enzyme related to lactoylglutathione lyase
VAQEDQKIDYIEFPASDFDAVQGFYEKAFGWAFVDYGPEYRAFMPPTSKRLATR